MLVHPDVHFTNALADHRKALEKSRRQPGGSARTGEAAEVAQPVRTGRRQFRPAQS